jgi:hypothetical protein
VAWNLVSGINDPPRDSERTIWVDGEATEVGPTKFAEGLIRIDFAEGGELHFAPEAERVRNENLGLVRSAYRQPFGTFAGRLPGDIELGNGFGVVEDHQVLW